MPAQSQSLEQQIENEFHVSWIIIAYKFIFGLIEVLIGVGLTIFGRSALLWYRAYASQELSEDPHDLLVRLSVGIVPNVLTHHTFLVLYLLILGVVKISGAIGLMYRQNWGVDLLVAVTLLMFPFQLVELVVHPSIANFLYIFIGLFVALYLVNFRPQEWAARVASQVKKRRHNR